MLMHRAGPDSLSVQAQFLGTCTIPKRKRGLTEVSSENRCYQNTTGGLANLAFSNPNKQCKQKFGWTLGPHMQLA